MGQTMTWDRQAPFSTIHLNGKVLLLVAWVWLVLPLTASSRGMLPLELWCQQVHGVSEDHTSSRSCFVEDGPTGSLHKYLGLSGADEEFVSNEGWAENHQQLALVPWWPCIWTHKEAPVDCQPPASPLWVGTEVAEPDNGPLAAYHLRWRVQISTLLGRSQA